MKTTLLRLLAAITISTTIPSPAIADESSNSAEQRYKDYISATPIQKEDLTKILFAAEIPNNTRPFGVSYELQNGLADSVIVGLVIAVTYKEAPSEKEQTIELYNDCGDTLPLTSTSGHIPFFQAEKIAKLSPTITLKEIRIRKIKS